MSTKTRSLEELKVMAFTATGIKSKITLSQKNIKPYAESLATSVSLIPYIIPAFNKSYKDTKMLKGQEGNRNIPI